MSLVKEDIVQRCNILFLFYKKEKDWTQDGSRCEVELTIILLLSWGSESLVLEYLSLTKN